MREKISNMIFLASLIITFFVPLKFVHASEIVKKQVVSLSLKRVYVNPIGSDHIAYNTNVNLNNVDTVKFEETYTDQGYIYSGECVETAGCQQVSHKKVVTLNNADSTSIDNFNFAVYLSSLDISTKQKAASFMANFGLSSSGEFEKYNHYSFDENVFDSTCQSIYDFYPKRYNTKEGETSKKYFVNNDVKIDSSKVYYAGENKNLIGNEISSVEYFKLKICLSKYYAAFAADLDDREYVDPYTVDYLNIGDTFYTEIGGMSEYVESNESFATNIKNKYVCMLGMHVDYGMKNGMDNIKSFIPDGENSLHATVLPDSVISGKSNEQILSLCESYFNATNVGVYKITDVSVNSTKSNIKNTSASLTCKWNYKPDDYDNSVVMSFRLNVSLKNHRMYFDAYNNIESLYPFLQFSHDEVVKILNNDKTFADKLENFIAKDVPSGYKVDEDFEDIKRIGVISIIGGVSLIVIGVVLTIATGGAAGGIAAKMASLGLKLTVFGIVDVAVINILNHTKNIVYSAFGVYTKGTVSFLYNHIDDEANLLKKIESSHPYSKIVCTYDDTPPDVEITPGEEVIECKTLLGDKFGKILSYVLNILRILAFALLALFSIFDFVKPIISNDADMLQKAGSTFVKRLIIFVMIFFVPALVKLLLTLIDKKSCSI